MCNNWSKISLNEFSINSRRGLKWRCIPELTKQVSGMKIAKNFLKISSRDRSENPQCPRLVCLRLHINLLCESNYIEQVSELKIFVFIIDFLCNLIKGFHNEGQTLFALPTSSIVNLEKLDSHFEVHKWFKNNANEWS